MKKAKKFMSLLVMFVMVFAMAIPTFAAEDGGNGMTTIKGSIIVDNPQQGQTYTAYKIFDVTYTTNDETVYKYTISKDSPWFDIVIQKDETSDIITSKVTGLTFTADSNESNTYIVTKEAGFSAAEFAKTLKAALDKSSEDEDNNKITGFQLTKTEDSKSVKASDLELGYYFVTSTSGALCSLTTTAPSVTIHDKNDVPFDKIDNKESVDVGETVTYTITGKVPDTTGFTAYVYTIKDTMSTGLTFNEEDVTVKIEDANGTVEKTLVKDKDYTYTKKDNGFELTIKVIELKNYVGKPIKVTYHATVNENAVAQIENNSATLTYSNNPSETTTTTTPPDEETVYSSKIVIDKYENGNSSNKLSGAKFRLYKTETSSEDDGNSDDDTTSKTKMYYKFGENSEKVEWVTNVQDATIKTTNESGAASFDGLADGTYYLEETEAPKDYNKLENPVEVVVNGANATTANLSALTVIKSIENSTGSLLPSTGGTGTTLFYIIGGILVVGAGVLLIAKRRMKSEK